MLILERIRLDYKDIYSSNMKESLQGAFKSPYRHIFVLITSFNPNPYVDYCRMRNHILLKY